MSELTLRQLIAAATDVLQDGGYRRGAAGQASELLLADLRLFEDPFGVVAVAAYSMWSDLVQDWRKAQATVANTISESLGKNEPKAWEGYLVLLTPEVPPPDTEAEERKIQYDTSLLRKFVGTGASLETTADIERLLLPLLPMKVDAQRKMSESLLDQVPSLLELEGVERELGKKIVQAFLDQESLPEAVHTHLWNDEA